MKYTVLLFSLIFAVPCYAVNWQTMGDHESCYSSQEQPCELKVKTRYGDVKITQTRNKNDSLVYQLFIAGEELETFEDISAVSIEGLYPAGNYDNLLISVSSGGNACPMEMYVVQLAANGQTVLSPSFGTCSDLYQAQVGKDGLIIEMPHYVNHIELLSKKEQIAAKRHKNARYRWLNGQLQSHE